MEIKGKMGRAWVDTASAQKKKKKRGPKQKTYEQITNKNETHFTKPADGAHRQGATAFATGPIQFLDAQKG
jgi:hypothetical protein